MKRDEFMTGFVLCLAIFGAIPLILYCTWQTIGTNIFVIVFGLSTLITIGLYSVGWFIEKKTEK